MIYISVTKKQKGLCKEYPNTNKVSVWVNIFTQSKGGKNNKRILLIGGKYENED